MGTAAFGYVICPSCNGDVPREKTVLIDGQYICVWCADGYQVTKEEWEER